ncbi:MAG: hypothetical protein H0V10_00690 [Geodermatophilaceae bacterium]|nr:hypothetical protein [Geodermatophilaceae bacterium]
MRYSARVPRRRSGRIAVGLVVAALALSACTAGSTTPSATTTATSTTSTSVPPTPPATTAAPTTVTPPLPELPGGGRTIFPTYRLVGFSGGPGSIALGRLTGDLDAAAVQIADQAAGYASARPVLPVFELIATVAHPFPTAEGDYSGRSDDAVIQEYLDAARRAGALLLLNVQPGRADFLPEVRAYEKWLREPDVGVALDPEWAVSPAGIPGEEYGQTTGAELDAVSTYLAQLVAEGNLPEKVMVYHQVASQVVVDEQLLLPHPGVVPIKSVDGIGGQAEKENTWDRLMPAKPPHVHAGFKLFYTEDLRTGGLLMTPEQVLALVPLPEYVLYE